MASLTEVARAAAKLEAFRMDRDEAIRLAHAKGSTIREIAKAARLSSARVHQILHGR